MNTMLNPIDATHRVRSTAVPGIVRRFRAIIVCNPRKSECRTPRPASVGEFLERLAG